MARLVLVAMLGLKWVLKRLHIDSHQRIAKMGKGAYFFGVHSVWYVGPTGMYRKNA